jgi:DNA-binding SARP family transcriptional activator
MSSSAIRVEVFAGRLRRGDVPIVINPREMALLFTLLSARRPWTRDDLHTALWPEAEPEAARNALGVCVHRLRRALGDQGAVQRTFAGYSLGPNVSVDLWDAEELEHRLRGTAPLSHSERTEAETLLTTLLSGSQLVAGYLPLEVLDRLALRAESVRRSVALRLAEDALTRSDAASALQCAGAILRTDPCDEAACEFAMRAHLLHDDRSSAIREYRAYRRIVSAELDLQPSPHLLAMLA